MMMVIINEHKTCCQLHRNDVFVVIVIVIDVVAQI